MIASLRGTVLDRSDHQVVVEVGGIGYSVAVTPRTLAELEPTSQAFLYVHHHFRDDLQMLYGFLSRDERSVFQMLISAHGVGPALALAILGTYEPRTLVEIIASQDQAALTAVPGVGKKTAERMIVELKSRVAHLESLGESRSVDGVPAGSEVREALTGLGYSPAEIRDAMNEIDSKTSSSEMLRDALRVLGARRA